MGAFSSMGFTGMGREPEKFLTGENMGHTMNGETKKRFEKVREEVEKGTPIYLAAPKHGMAITTYMKHAGLKKSKPARKQKLITLPEVETKPQQVIMFVGSPDAMAALARSMQ